MPEHQPAVLHRVACYVLLRFGEHLAAQGLKRDPQRDHRIVYQNVLFLCGDALRTAIPPCDLGLQTTFQAPTPEWPFRPLARLMTIETVIRQCVSHQWLVPPGPQAHPTNYQLTAEGKNIALSLKEESISAPLVPEHLRIVDKLLVRWSGAPAWDFAPALREVAAAAFLEDRVVPHYDLSDESLTHFLAGVARRARSVQV